MGSYGKGISMAILVLAAIVIIAALTWRGSPAMRPLQPSKSGFRPVPVTTCGNPPVHQEYAVDMTSRNAAGTVAWHPYSTQSRVSLERYAESPENAEELNPVTGLGKTNFVRKLADRYRGDEAMAGSPYELQPGQPGYMEEVGDGAMGLAANVSARPPASVATGAPVCLLAGADVDSDYLTDGYYGERVIQEALVPRRETLTSRREALPNTLTASKTGLGSIRIDPRFEPGPESRTPDGDASWSQGGAAGGPTSGTWASSTFMPPPSYDATYIHAFGDYNVFGRQYPVEAMRTGESRW